MIRTWKAAGWGKRLLALVCLYVIALSLTSLVSLFLAEVREGDPLDRFTVARLVQTEKQTAIVYSYWHANSSVELTAIHLAERDVPAVGAVFYRKPVGRQVLITNVAPTKVGVRWSPSDRPQVTLPAHVLRESDWNQRGTCFFKEDALHACWDSAQIDVE